MATSAARSITPSATVVSDGLWRFDVARVVGAEHARIVTGGGEASTELPQVKAVNTFLDNLKRSLAVTYHAFDFAKYAHRHLAEARYRFNRRLNLHSMLAPRCAPPAFQLQARRTSFVWLRLVSLQNSAISASA